MRVLIVLAALVVGMLIAGWMTFRRGNGTATVTVETRKIQEDTARLVKQGREALDDAADRLKDGQEKPSPETTPVR